MEPHIERANRALFEGNRPEVIEILKDRAHTGQEFWLLAAAVEDDNERLELLKRVHAIGQQPYADLAAEILRREAYFEAALRQGPAWQRWLITRREAILRLGIAVLVLSVTLLLLGVLFAP